MATRDLREIAPNLERGSEGWWNVPALSQVSYPEEGNSLCFQVEDSSFWFTHRNRCILHAIQRFPAGGTLFDVGGGNGCVARAIQDSGLDVVLVEPGIEGVRNAVRRGIRDAVRATLEDAGVLPDTVPAVGLFDVVEHIQDDLGFLTTIHRLLKPGGRVYLTVPAYQWLWSEEDTLAGHARRYTANSMRGLLERAGYSVEFVTYFFFFLPLPVLLRRALPYRLGIAPKKMREDSVRADHEIGSPLAKRVLDTLTGWESSRIAKGLPMWTGGSCLAVARKV